MAGSSRPVKTHRLSTNELNHEAQLISSREVPSEDDELGFDKPTDVYRSDVEKAPHTPRSKPARNDSLPFATMEKTSQFTKDLRATFNELLYTCRLMFSVHFHLKNAAYIIHEVWGDNIFLDDLIRGVEEKVTSWPRLAAKSGARMMGIEKDEQWDLRTYLSINYDRSGSFGHFG